MCKLCKENTAIIAKGNDKINFGHVDSCITIVATLEDGTRVAGHLVQDKGKGTVLKAMKKNIGVDKVKSVQIVGQFTSWTPDLENQKEIINRSAKKLLPEQEKEMREGKTYPVQQKYGHLWKKESAYNNQSKLKQYVGKEFKCQLNNISVKQHESGQLKY